MSRAPCLACAFYRDIPNPRCLAESPEAIGRELMAESCWPCSLFSSEPDSEEEAIDD